MLNRNIEIQLKPLTSCYNNIRIDFFENKITTLYPIFTTNVIKVNQIAFIITYT
jgi:hypothetical protein